MTEQEHSTRSFQGGKYLYSTAASRVSRGEDLETDSRIGPPLHR